MKGVLFSNGRYTKGVPFLPEMVYKTKKGEGSDTFGVVVFFCL